MYQSDVLVTTLIDFYALPKDFPNYEKATSIPSKSDRLKFLEQAIIKDLEEEKNNQFPNLIPYIQLHEFEALVFSSLNAIKALYTEEEARFDKLEQIISKYPNPEDINDDPDTAPSRRLKNSELIRGYSKVNDGIIIIEEAGIGTVLKKCMRLNSWVETLLEKATA